LSSVPILREQRQGHPPHPYSLFWPLPHQRQTCPLHSAVFILCTSNLRLDIVLLYCSNQNVVQFLLDFSCLPEVTPATQLLGICVPYRGPGFTLGHVIGERKSIIIYGECYLSAIMHNKSEFGLKKLKK
jgi:hypothetical protein